MRAFVTGATGLLGNNLVRSLEAAGHEVVALARNPRKASRVLAGTRATLVEGDMLRVGHFATRLAGCDAVFHTAAYFREAFEPGADEDAIHAVNIGGTMALLDAAADAGVPCFVHTSSGGVIGRKPDGRPGDEDTPPLPVQRRHLYFRSKLKADAALSAWTRAHQVSIVEILPGWIWGPWDAAPTAAGKLVGEFVAGKIPANISGGTSIVDARDVAAAMIAAAHRSLERGPAADAGGSGIEKFVVGGRYHDMPQIMRHVEAATGSPAPRMTIPFPVLLAYSYGCVAWAKATGGAALITPDAVRTMHAKLALDSSKAERELGVTFRDTGGTIRDAVEWLREHGVVAEG